MGRSATVGRPGTVSIITGGARGIGRALTEALARRGGHVVIADIDAPAAVAAAGELRTAGLRASAYAVDVTDRAAVRRLIDDTVAQNGRLDLMVNNAGVATIGQAHRLSDEQWDAALDVNLHGVLHGVRAAYPLMLEQGSGVILNVASLLGMLPSPFAAPYATSKSGVIGLSLALRAEARAQGVTVSVVCPGFIRTDITPDARAQWWRVRATPDRLADAILRGLDAERAVIVWPRSARVVWWLERASPALTNTVSATVARRVTARMRRQGPAGDPDT